MAQLNCPTCYNGMFVEQWGNLCQDPQRSGSNVSLNMPPAGYPMPMNPMWMNPMGPWHGASPNMMGMYPFPMVMTPTSQSESRSHSRAASPTPSIKSRKSHVSKAGRKYKDDSDEDRHSVFSYADKSERKSVRDRAERIRAKKEAEDSRDKRITSPERRDKIDDRLERMSIRSKREDDDFRSDRDLLQERRETSVKDDIFERVSIRNKQDPDDFKREKITSTDRRRSKQKNISSESDDYKSDSYKESLENSEVESKESDKHTEEILVVDSIEPQIPDQEWECEHCTFVNPAGTRVCTVCCKTPTVKVKTLKSTNTTHTKPKTTNKVSSGTNTQTTAPQNSNKETKKKTSEAGTKFGKNNLDDEPVLNHINGAYEGLNSKVKASETQKKGRTLRKITFWPGTKFPPFYK